MDATIESLVEYGFSGTTMQRVQELAGVSRGTLTHHFGSMQLLLAAAITHVADRQLEETRRLLEVRGVSAPGPDEVVELLSRFMSGPTFVAGLELWLAARTDETLRSALAPAEKEFGRKLRRAVARAKSAENGAQVSFNDLEALLVLFRGLAVTRVLQRDDRTERRLLRDWAERVSITAGTGETSSAPS